MQKLIDAFNRNPNHVQFIAEADNILVGAIEFRNGEKDKVSHQGSFGMTVLPTYRNHGIGKALLQTLVNWAKANNTIEKICLEVMEGNQGAITLYEKFGFLEEGRKVKGVKLNNGYQDLILMYLFV